MATNATQGSAHRSPNKRVAIGSTRAPLSSAFRPQATRLISLLVPIVICFSAISAWPETAPQLLEISRPARPWEFLSVVGRNAGLFGNESGRLEAWAYPLKILRDFRLSFHVDGETLPGETLVRSVIVRPESTMILYAGDAFAVRETLCVPVEEPGALIKLEIETTQPIDVQVSFERDFQLEWPATMGGTAIDWDPRLHAFLMTEAEKKFEAVVGSPSATEPREEYQTNYSSSRESSFWLGPAAKGRTTKIIVIAAATTDHGSAARLFQAMSLNYDRLIEDTARFYQSYLSKNVQLTLPDGELQKAYEWAQISMVQGLVENPFLGTGLIAGYRTSGNDQRPGYAWFFGRDTFWTTLAFDATGDFPTVRTALAFMAKYQRADGKMPHEIAQGASLVPWFTTLPFAYSSADATPLYLIALNDYVLRSGDLDFARQEWDHVAKAYSFLLSTYDANGLPQNGIIGHGWVESGPLYPVKSELYQSALALEAVRALCSLARLLNKDSVSQGFDQEFARRKLALNRTFWIPGKQHYAFALDAHDAQVDIPTVLATVPMWFDLLDPEKANFTITELSQPSFRTDWGMRILSSQDPRYDPGGYHSGAVWPLFTGWASVGEYRYHRPLEAFANLRTNALLTFGGTPGRVTEVLSGNYYQTLSTGSPYQVWSSAMVVSPLLRGLFGLEANAITRSLIFAPHVPADWTAFTIRNLKVGSSVVKLDYTKTSESVSLNVERTAGDECVLEFAPALSRRAQVQSVSLDGHRIPFRLEQNGEDQHLHLQFTVGAKPQRLLIRLRDDFGLSEPAELPLLADSSHGVRVLSQSWTPSLDALTLAIAGTPDEHYELGVWNPRQIASVEGAQLIPVDQDHAKLAVQIPAASGAKGTQLPIVIHFRAAGKQQGKNSGSSPTAVSAP